MPLQLRLYLGKQFSFCLITLLFMAGILLPALSIAQTSTVSGKVTGSDGSPVAGVTVQEKGGGAGAATDAGGNFSLSVTNANASLVISSLGYESQTISLNGRSALNVTLKGAVAKELEQVVVIGYGNYNYCVANPSHFYGYSNMNWGLTASDDNISGYKAHAPDNDDGVITPSAAISSLPYTPTQSMDAIKFFYYTLGDKLWKDYGFIDAFNLNDIWFADSFLAIDQGPEIVMIENYRTGLLWNLFMSCPEIKRGMKQLGFQSPNL